MNDPTNHKVYSYVTEEYFYKVLQRAKVENLYADEHGRIDINKLIQLMWETFADGKYIIIPNHECREKVTNFIKSLSACDDAKVEAVAEMIIDAKPKRKSRAKPKVDENKASTGIEFADVSPNAG
jgi:hypothetical protein